MGACNVAHTKCAHGDTITGYSNAKTEAPNQTGMYTGGLFFIWWALWKEPDLKDMLLILTHF